MTETRPGNSALDPGLLVKPSSTLSLSAPQSLYLQKGLDRIVSGADILGLFFHCPLRSCRGVRWRFLEPSSSQGSSVPASGFRGVI